MDEHLTRLYAVLGPASGPGAAAEDWQRLEAELGVDLPADLKVLTDRYAPVRLNGSVHLSNPSTEVNGLGHYIRETVEVYRDCEFTEENFPGFAEPLGFGGPDGLIPITGTPHGEHVFLHRDRAAGAWSVVVYVGADDEFYRYPMSFAEWLRRYLDGESVAGPNSEQVVPGPVRIEDLPAGPGATPTERLGPPR
ncbi:Cell wall assembly regulator SMI1 [Streptomyces sp. TLI_053]|uniref:SMI1/KNR4 family protein n=1 Tax=Streptomyces sp. TLI_053 TaxID=1855352 RepID=UPI00087D7F9E|nr:SMI1/KNR4 family protein [Streptomyces sp. TLI_053]SDS79236.1 Cell wall assembly regulator SMI1 [Streptomyces sp. TLI_053]